MHSCARAGASNATPRICRSVIATRLWSLRHNLSAKDTRKSRPSVAPISATHHCIITDDISATMCDKKKQDQLDAFREGCVHLGLHDNCAEELVQVLEYCPMGLPSAGRTNHYAQFIGGEQGAGDTARVPPLGYSLSPDLLRLKEYMHLHIEVCLWVGWWARKFRRWRRRRTPRRTGGGGGG